MEEKRRPKRSKILDEGYWDCSVCTYQNSPEAFKCDMCDVRKGTSTRKPRLNAQLVAQQGAQQFAAPPKKDKNIFRRDRNSASTSSSPTNTMNSHKKERRPPRLKNIDRSSGVSMEVTVGSVTVVITDYQVTPAADPTATLPPTNLNSNEPPNTPRTPGSLPNGSGGRRDDDGMTT